MESFDVSDKKNSEIYLQLFGSKFCQQAGSNKIWNIYDDKTHTYIEINAWKEICKSQKQNWIF